MSKLSSSCDASPGLPLSDFVLLLQVVFKVRLVPFELANLRSWRLVAGSLMIVLF